MSWGAVAGAAVSVVGGALSNKGSGKKSTSKLLPYNTSNLWGDVAFDTKKRTLTTNLSPFAQGAVDQFQSGFDVYGADPRAGLGMGIQTGAINDMLGAYGAAQAYGGPDPRLLGSTMAGYGGVMGGMGNLFGAAMSNPYAQQMADVGMGLLGTQGRNYDDVMSSRLDLLRQQAAPYEERAQNSLLNKLYGMGQLGTPGGQLGLESFGKGMAMADLGRQVEAQNLGQQLWTQDQQFALGNRQLGGNLFSNAASNWMSGLGVAGNAATAMGGLLTDRYNTGMNFDATNYTRTTDRLARTSDLFGFGNLLENIPLDKQAQFLNLMSGISGEGQNLAKLGIEAAGQSQTSGMQNPWQSAVGGLLSGIGAGMGTGTGLGGSIAGLFGGGK